LGDFEWGGTIIHEQRNWHGTITGTATKMRLADYVFERVLTRKLPKVNSTRPPSVVMKMDIEGSELEVTTDLIVSGAMQVYELIIFKELLNCLDKKRLMHFKGIYMF
jgi:hypothetical protein